MHHRHYSRHSRIGPRSSHGRSSHFHRWGRGGARARRGDIRAAVLALLEEKPMHGYEMITEVEDRTGGAWRPSAGSIYPTLQLLEDEGLIEGTEAEGKRRFELTEAGREERAARSGPAWDEVTAAPIPSCAARALRAATAPGGRPGLLRRRRGAAPQGPRVAGRDASQGLRGARRRRLSRIPRRHLLLATSNTREGVA